MQHFLRPLILVERWNCAKWLWFKRVLCEGTHLVLYSRGIARPIGRISQSSRKKLPRKKLHKKVRPEWSATLEEMNWVSMHYILLLLCCTHEQLLREGSEKKYITEKDDRTFTGLQLSFCPFVSYTHTHTHTLVRTSSLPALLLAFTAQCYCWRSCTITVLILWGMHQWSEDVRFYYYTHTHTNQKVEQQRNFFYSSRVLLLT